MIAWIAVGAVLFAFYGALALCQRLLDEEFSGWAMWGLTAVYVPATAIPLGAALASSSDGWALAVGGLTVVIPFVWGMRRRERPGR